jgi:hypothetical protein
MLDVVAIVLLGIAMQILVGALAQWIDPAADPATWPTGASVLLATALPALVIGAVMPMVRADRAGPGAWATILSIRRNNGDGPPTAGQMVLRTAVRWAPFVVLSIGGPIPALLFLALASTQLLTVLVRRDHASIAGMVSATRSELCPGTAADRDPEGPGTETIRPPDRQHP